MRSLRFALLSLSITLVLLLLAAASAHGVFAGTPTPPPTPVPSLQFDPPMPCVGRPVTLLAVVPRCPPCVDAVTWGASDSVHARIYVHAHECMTFTVCPPDTLRIPLGLFSAGFHHVDVKLRAVLALANTAHDSLVFDSTITLPFTVTAECVPTPPGPLPNVEVVRIGGPPPCDDCPPVACAGSPIPVRVAGHFPDGCWSVRGVQFLPSPLTVIGPPILRILLDDGACLGRACTLNAPPWSVDTLLPPLPRGQYALRVQIGVTSCADSIPPGKLFAAEFPFLVGARCSTGTARDCFIADWGPQQPGTACNTYVAPGQDGDVTLGVRSTVRLAGLQGVLRASPGLVVRDLEAVGAAAGMNLQWVPTVDGARFVMFATRGAPIPACLPPDSIWVFPTRLPPPVLKITVGLAPGADPQRVMMVRADSLLGADSLARLVLECPDLSMRPEVAGAHVCLAASCDANGDGHSDVRDLVVMAHCILGSGACADSIAGRHDCDGDGRATLADILCCAHAILHGAPGDTLPERKDPLVALRFGEPGRGDSHLTLPITLENADHVGALRMTLRFPADRYDLSAFGSTAGSSWLALHEVQDGEVVVGLVALAPVAEGATVPLTLDLALKPGQTHGGEITVASAEVSAPDGASLATSIPGASTPIATPTRVSLAIHPNPLVGAGATVSFTLPRAGSVDLALFDIAGRRVATLAQGVMPAGAYTRAWDAQGVRDGVYFVRLRADGLEVARKAVLRRGR